jgi:hypothetical protein
MDLKRLAHAKNLRAKMARMEKEADNLSKRLLPEFILETQSMLRENFGLESCYHHYEGWEDGYQHCIVIISTQSTHNDYYTIWKKFAEERSMLFWEAIGTQRERFEINDYGLDHLENHQYSWDVLPPKENKPKALE